MKYILALLFLASSICYAHHAAIVCDDGRTVVIEGDAQPDSWDKYCKKVKTKIQEAEPEVDEEPASEGDVEGEPASEPDESSGEPEDEYIPPPTDPCLGFDRSKYSVKLKNRVITLKHESKHSLDLVVYYIDANNNYQSMCRVLMGYIDFDEYYKKITLKELRDIIVDCRQPYVKQGRAFCNRAIEEHGISKLDLQVNGCVIATFEKNVPNAPSLTRKPKLAIMWASLKQ